MKITSELPEKQRTAMTTASGIADSGFQGPTQSAPFASVADDAVPIVFGSNVTSLTSKLLNSVLGIWSKTKQNRSFSV